MARAAAAPWPQFLRFSSATPEDGKALGLLFFLQPAGRILTMSDKPAQTSGYVYFLHAPSLNLVKIGFSRKPALRLDDVAQAIPVPTELLVQCLGTLSQERALHHVFGSLRQHGEWFRAESSLLAFVASQRHNEQISFDALVQN